MVAAPDSQRNTAGVRTIKVAPALVAEGAEDATLDIEVEVDEDSPTDAVASPDESTAPEAAPAPEPAAAQELVRNVRANVTIDWTLREDVRAQLRVLVKRILRKYGAGWAPRLGLSPPSMTERRASISAL